MNRFICILGTTVVLVTTPVWGEDRSPSTELVNPPLLLQALDFADTARFMEEFYRRSVDAWHDHVEFEGGLQPGQNGERWGYLSLKLYPKGKAQSDESMTAETWLGFSNGPKEDHLHFDFKLSKQPKTPFSPEEYL